MNDADESCCYCFGSIALENKALSTDKKCQSVLLTGIPFLF
jgi:hypothetical protein